MKILINLVLLALVIAGCATNQVKPTVYQVGPEAFANISSNAKIHWWSRAETCPVVEGVSCAPRPIRKLLFNRLPTYQETIEGDKIELKEGGFALAMIEGRYVASSESSPVGIFETAVNTGLAAVALVTPGPIGQFAGGMLVHTPTSAITTVTTKRTFLPGTYYKFFYPDGKTATAVCPVADQKIEGACRGKMLQALKDRVLQNQTAKSPG